MRWLLGAALLLCAGALWAQSLGDVAREQREENKQPKATHVYTNADLGVPDGVLVMKPEKPAKQMTSQKAPAKSRPDPVHQRRIAELNQRAKLLQNEMQDLQSRLTALSRSSNYGDPNRVQKNQEMKQLAESLDAKGKELASVRGELQEENEQARKSSVVK